MWSFIRKEADGTYCELGWDWDLGKEKILTYDKEKAVIISPLYSGFISEKWRKALRQEDVTVPKGTELEIEINYLNVGERILSCGLLFLVIASLCFIAFYISSLFNI